MHLELADPRGGEADPNQQLAGERGPYRRAARAATVPCARAAAAPVVWACGIMSPASEERSGGWTGGDWRNVSGTYNKYNLGTEQSPPLISMPYPGRGARKGQVPSPKCKSLLTLVL